MLQIRKDTRTRTMKYHMHTLIKTNQLKRNNGEI